MDRAGPLNGRTALVTGAASGIGKAIAHRLVADGAQVVITDVQEELGHEAAHAGGFTFLEQDVSNELRWTEVVREVEGRFGAVHVLVNNAGIAGGMDHATPEDTRLADWRKTFAVNVEGVFLGCRAIIPAMRRAGGGSIINVSSVAGLLATPYATAYGASKACVRQLTKSVAQYCAQQKLNIRCNSVHPGSVQTPLWDRYAQVAASARGMSFEEFLAASQREVPLGDFTTLEDVAAAVAFLASDDSRHITGTKLIVDGGIINCDTYNSAARRESA
jgi:NAD(P)-dependent dehydrogenase (short-subunit alcohol dehydrogenase family)